MTEQPDPVPNGGPSVWGLVLDDMRRRDQTGEARYGVRLQPFNGRDALWDLYEELLDAVVYLRQVIYERNELTGRAARLEVENAVLRQQLTGGPKAQEEWTGE